MMEQERSAKQIMAALFQGQERSAQMALMSRLEKTGGSLYRKWAESERNDKARERLIEAAEREEANAELLRVMTTVKNACERCDAPLMDEAPAYCCSFQCTFCTACATSLAFVCPNCGGELSQRQSF